MAAHFGLPPAEEAGLRGNAMEPIPASDPEFFAWMNDYQRPS
jgi:hypothetical protein